MVPAHPMKTTGLRPILSESAPQNIPLHASANENADMSSPAKKGAFDAEETSKFKTSFHAYGSMLVKAIGSATRTSASRKS